LEYVSQLLGMARCGDLLDWSLDAMLHVCRHRLDLASH
jgi:hypothetical protein